MSQIALWLLVAALVLIPASSAFLSAPAPLLLDSCGNTVQVRR